ncbi:SusD-like proteins [Proteiniphilum saccharofermentans]|uniref:SusD-like proteins n=1 Tax=Proteiniphilum saccharofermentans TaxID=1642647 RepID=A0A1R3T6E6_9BACT|nr:RagB/SusD family nutrient uptake outer membrane protein [Proteiniphilum saccharofermentans]SCD21802.1 SusD-like proteins [Proteiniphilum saccharofermentans]
MNTSIYKYKHIQRNIVIAAVLVSLGFVSSCDDLLDQTSQTSLSSATIFDTPARIEGLVNGAYRSLKSANLYSGRLVQYGDLRGEDFVIRTENALAGGYVWANSFTNLTGDINSVWEQAYVVINNANVLIEGLDRSEGVISDGQKRNYIAEARFLRGLAYFHLVTFYGRPYIESGGQDKAVPLRLQAEVSSANNNLARSTVFDVYKQIIEDLDYAEVNLPESYSSALLNTTRAHKNTAIALKTRVYLNKGEFDKVIEEAKKIVPQDEAPFSATTGVTHALNADITTIFNADYTTTESVFSMPMTVADPPGGAALANVYYSAPDFVLNTEPAGIISDTEWRESDARRNFVSYNSSLGLYLLAKYTKVSPAIDYIPVIRYPEVLLNYAEAEARSTSGDLNKAVALLKAVRNRSDAAYIFPAQALAQDQILTTIRVERRIELLGEGFRANDILRDLQTFPGKPSLASLTARQVGPADEGYVFPIPNSEILTNELINE